MTGAELEFWVFSLLLSLLSANCMILPSQVRVCSQGWFVKTNQHKFYRKYGYWSEIYDLRGNTGLKKNYIEICKEVLDGFGELQGLKRSPGMAPGAWSWLLAKLSSFFAPCPVSSASHWHCREQDFLRSKIKDPPNHP